MSYIISAVVCAGLFVLDQLTKNLAMERLLPIVSHPLIPGFIEFRYQTNEGAAYGMFQGARWVLLIFTLVVVTVMAVLYVKFPKGRVYSFMRAAMTLVAAGALGNAFDRARQGFVVDFLNFQFINFPVFNVADMCIVCGTVSLAVIVLFFLKEKSADGDGN